MNIGDVAGQLGKKTLPALLKTLHRTIIADTTLRDGEQAPGASLNPDQKLLIARQLDELGVDSIETGFPVSSEQEFEAVKLIAQHISRPVLTALSRCRKKDIDAVVQSLGAARHWSISLFIGVSPLLRKYSVHKSKKQILEVIKDSIQYARTFTDTVAFGAEDATRTEPDFLYKVYETAINSGAFIVAVPDTVGICLPHQVTNLIASIKNKVPNINKALMAVHFHNDLGLAVANSLAAIEAGVHIVQTTMNGVGERAGNTALEEFVLALHVRQDYFKRKTNVKLAKLWETSQLVSKTMDMPLCPYKAVVGKNVFATEAGIHQAALLQKRATYEIIDPELVGQPPITFVLGRHSGTHAINYTLQKLGYVLRGKDDDLNYIYEKFKKIAATKKEVSPQELDQIAKTVLRAGKKK